MKTKRQLGIEDVNLCSPEVGRISSPLSLQAMREVGIELSDLAYIPKSEFQKQLLSKDMLEQRYSHHEARRFAYIREVRQARQRLLESCNVSTASPRPSERDLKASVVTPVREMEAKERRRLLKLQQHKQRALEQIIAAETRQQQLLHELEDSKQREALKEKQRLEELQRRQQAVLQQKRLFEARKARQDAEVQLPEHSRQLREKSSSPEPVERLDSFDQKLREIQGKLEKRSLERQCAREDRLNAVNCSGALDQSLAKCMKALETEESLQQMQSEYSLELKEKFRRHEEKLRELRSVRAKKQEERQARAEMKAEHIRAMEKEREKQMEDARLQLRNKELSAEQRFLQFMRQKEEHIGELARKEAVKQLESDKKRKKMREGEQQKAESLVVGLQQTDRKVEQVRSERAREWALRKEVLSERRSDKYKQALRLRKIEEYQRMKTLEQIQEESEFLTQLKASKEREQLLKQRLRKDLESEKKLLADRFDRLLLTRSNKLIQSLQTSRPVSLSPLRMRETSVTPSAAPVPQSLNRSVSNAILEPSDSRLEEAKVRHDRELMEMLREENVREQERGERIAAVQDEAHAQQLEEQFQRERKEANRRIVELSEKQAEYEKTLEARVLP